VPQNRRGRSRVPSDVKILTAGSNNLLLPEPKYVQVQSSSVARAAWDLELRDCCSIGYLSTDHFTMAALHLEAAPVSLFLCAVMLSAWFGGVGPGLLARPAMKKTSTVRITRCWGPAQGGERAIRRVLIP
jgi:hypothetical protein